MRYALGMVARAAILAITAGRFRGHLGVHSRVHFREHFRERGRGSNFAVRVLCAFLILGAALGIPKLIP